MRSPLYIYSMCASFNELWFFIHHIQFPLNCNTISFLPNMLDVYTLKSFIYFTRKLWARAMFQTNLQLILNHVMMLIHACMLFSCYLLFFIWHDNHDSVKFLLFRVMIMEDKKFKSQARYYSSVNPSYFIVRKYSMKNTLFIWYLKFMLFEIMKWFIFVYS